MPRSWRAGAVVLAATPLLLGACSGDESGPQSGPSDPGTPLASYATDRVAVVRAAFCEELPPEAVEAALDGSAAATTTYENGERTRLAPGLRDVAHEYGCTYESEDGTTARAWLFAPPVTAQRAGELAERARTARGCRSDEKGPRFGQPSLALVCDAGGEVTVSYRGLFGDAWLSCSVSAPAGNVAEADLVDRAGRWCVQVAEAASG
jgi:hypothetical protein